MRTRSSRLFIVLIHVIGVSTTIPGQHGTSFTKINKYAVILEKLLLDEDRLDGLDGLDALLRRSIEDGEESDIFSEPFWIQDQVDGLCLTPFGFSDCGDASLWYIRPDIQRKRTWRHRDNNKVRENFNYALEYVNTGGGKSECLLTTKRRIPKENAATPFGSCESQFDRAFGWHINGRGVLHSYKGRKVSRNSVFAQCLWRYNLTSSTLGSCSPSSFNGPNNGRRLAKLSLVRHESAAAAAKRAANCLAQAKNTTWLSHKPVVVSKNETKSEDNSFPAEQIPRSKDRAHSQASEPVHHHKLKAFKKVGSAAGGLVTGVGVCTENLCGLSKRKGSVVTSKKTLLKLGETKPILFREEKETRGIKKQKSLAHSTSKKLDFNDAAHKLRRLETHPYIAVAKNEIWTDSQTGLQFPTDLCRYLGQDLKSAGRHTLTGMGYYTKTIMNIKIYGVGLYVSKRDILADPPFQKYASLNALELRSKPDFYDHLRNMPSEDDPTTGFFDRTIFIKINMQLSVATMQSSLRATWKLLTEEAKNLMINSSMEPRPAEKQMLELIKSPENPGRCSCSQLAPPEYKADPTCCARGTELVFTWRKNGNLEIRLDGRIMDIFPRPDVARGVFYEYLRLDDPMSVEFLQKVVDGFPFLLGPLSHVKGMSLTMNKNDMRQHQEEVKATSGSGIRAVGNIVNVISSHASAHAGDFADWVHTGADNAGNAARAFGDSAKLVAEGIDHRRDQLFKQVSMLPENGMNFVKRRIVRTRQDELANTVSHYLQRHRRGEILMKEKGSSIAAAPRGRIFRSSIDRWFGISSHSDLVLPVSRNDYEGSFLGGFFFLMVHLYLLLILIVSLPETHKTKVMRRSLKKGKCAAYTIGTDEECSTESSSLEDDTTFPPTQSDWMIESESLTDYNMDSSINHRSSMDY